MRAFFALTFVCLLSSIAACDRNRPAVTTVYEQVYIPDVMLPGCPAVEWSGGTFRDVGSLAEMRAAALKDCDDKFTAARKYQEGLRAKAKAAAKGM